MILFLFSSCKTNNVKNNTITSFVENYLQNRYSDSFEIVDIYESKTPGVPAITHEVKVASNKYTRRNFIVFVEEDKGELSLNEDGYPRLLLEVAFFDKLDFTEYEDFPCIIETDLYRASDKDQQGRILNESDATKELNSLNEASWFTSLFIIVDDIKEQKYEIEDMVINYANIINQSIAGAHDVSVYLYTDTSLDKADLIPNMNLKRMNRIPSRDKVKEEWIFGFYPSKLEKAANGMRSIVGKKRVVPYIF